MTRFKITLMIGVIIALVGSAVVRQPLPTNFATSPGMFFFTPAPSGSGDCPFDQYLTATAAKQLPSGDLQVLSPPTLKATFLAVQTLQLLNYAGDVNASAVEAYVRACYDPLSGLFRDSVTNAFDGGMRVAGYSDVEATYYALATLNLLGALDANEWQGVVTMLHGRYDAISGGFWCRVGVETLHDTYFGCAALRLLGAADLLDSGHVRTFVNAHQYVDPTEWWQVGGFYNIQNDTARDFDFETPNVVSAYYAAAALADRGQLPALDSVDLVQFINMYRNITTGTFSIGGGYDIAENIGSAFVVALDPFLANPSMIDITTAATALVARLNAGQFREGNSAPLNHTIAAACEMVWGVAGAGRLNQLTASTNASLRAFISTFYETAGSQGGYATTNDASLGDIAAIIGAAGDASKLNAYNVDALCAYVNNTYAAWGPYFLNYGSSFLHCDLPAEFGCAADTGPLSAGIPATLQGLEALNSMGRLNVFLGHIGGAGKILPNVTDSQFLNVSAGASHGAFAPNEYWAVLCQTMPVYRNLLVPQWTLQALAIIALLDPASPQSHFDAAAAWNYISQFYAESDTTAYFMPPSYLQVTPAAWTASVAMALIQAGMSNYFALGKVTNWLAASLNRSSLPEVARYLELAAADGIHIPPLLFDAPAFNTLETTLLATGSTWYHAPGGIWPETSTVHDLDTIRKDRQLYIVSISIPTEAKDGASVTGSAWFCSLFDPTVPGVTATFSLMGASSPMIIGNGLYAGVCYVPQDAYFGTQAATISVTKLGWVANQVTQPIQIDGKNPPSGSESNNNDTKSNSTNRENDTQDPPLGDPIAGALTSVPLWVGGTGGLGLAGAGTVMKRRNLRKNPGQ